MRHLFSIASRGVRLAKQADSPIEPAQGLVPPTRPFPRRLQGLGDDPILLLEREGDF
jgi:hypothetical protein